MPVLQNLYQVFKISSSDIVKNNLIIDNYTKIQAEKDGHLVSIGDNMLFHKIRDYYGDKRDHHDIFNEIIELRKTLKICKKQKKFKEAAVVNQQIVNTLFVKDVIVVTCERKKDYKYVGKNDFTLNGIKFTRFCAGAGNLRRNVAIYVNKNLYSYLYEAFMCGLADSMHEAVLSKLGAYFALCFSSVYWVRTPRCCVIKDFENIIYNQNIDFICQKTENDTPYIEKRQMDIVLNCADGQGLIDPEFSSLWAQDMGIDYTPSSFVVRSCFVKGNLVPFDFKSYAKENNIDVIYDRWGVPYYIDDIDVLLSESQFKEYKEYNSWQEYMNYFNKYNLRWGVARYNKKYDDENVLANYQYIQSLDLKEDDIKEMVKPTIEWFKKICNGEELYSLLFMLGPKNEESGFYSIMSSAQSVTTKAILKNRAMINDTYIQNKIYRNIVEYINRGKIGKIWLRGNYQFMISDPIAQCRSALGLSIEGEVPADHIYSNFWRMRGVSGVVDCCRSPMIDTHEHNPSVLYESENANKWYKYIKSGIIYSIYDTSTARHSDSDFDGDIVLTTDNKYFINGSHKEQNIITYEKGMAVKEKINKNNFIEKDLMGFGTAVGSFSNTATILYAMIGGFVGENQKKQRDELYQRIKLLRRYVGQEIDRAKLGIKQPKLPKEWKKREKIDYTNDTQDIIQEKSYRNSLVVSKKPYFFRYLYPELNQKYKKYEELFDIISRDKFGKRFKSLYKTEEKTAEEKKLIQRYKKYSPLIMSNCTMNILCREMESVEFNIKYKKNKVSILPKPSDDFNFDPEKVDKIRNLYKIYNGNKSLSVLNFVFKGVKNEEELREIKINELDYIRDYIRDKLLEYEINNEDFLNYSWKISYNYSNYNWSFVWDVLGDDVLDIIDEGETAIPIRDENGSEYLGSKYSLKIISLEEKNDKRD